MKKQASVIRHVALALAIPAVAALAGAQFACAATTAPMLASTSIPAGEGTVDVTDGDDGNTNLAVRVSHLALPSRVASDAMVYVVWIRPRAAEWQSLGLLAVDDDLDGSLDAVTTHRRFEGIVTPEPSGQGTQPTHEPVFTFDVQRPE